MVPRAAGQHDPQLEKLHSGAAQVGSPPPCILLDVCPCIVTGAAFPPHGAKAAVSSLPLQLLLLIWEEKTKQRGIYGDPKLLFSHSITAIKSRDFAPDCCQADDGCLRASFTRWNINSVCRESASRLNRECEDRPEAAAGALPRGLNPFKSATVFTIFNQTWVLLGFNNEDSHCTTGQVLLYGEIWGRSRRWQDACCHLVVGGSIQTVKRTGDGDV